MSSDSVDMLAERDYKAFTTDLAAYLRFLNEDPDNAAEVVALQARLRDSYFKIVDKVVERTGWSNPLGVWPDGEEDDGGDEAPPDNSSAAEPFDLGVRVTVLDDEQFREKASASLGPDCLEDASAMSGRAVFTLLFARAMHDLMEDVENTIRVEELELED